jgi:RNA polymerase II C-terminal domain phosphatase-like 1/2
LKFLADVSVSQNQVSNSRESPTEAGKLNLLPSPLSIGVLQEIARRCSSKVEFRSVLSTSKDLQFSVEVLFTGEKIGVGMGKTRKDAQQQAAENALHSLADKYVSYIAPRSGAVDRDFDKLSLGTENGFIWDIVSPGSNEFLKEDGVAKESTSEASEDEPRSTSNVINQVQKRANSPRLPNSIPSKRSKDELFRGSQSIPSFRKQKNGHSVS